MSGVDTPTPGEAFEATLYTWVDWKGRYRDEEEARAAWGRMITEVARTAAERGFAQGAGRALELTGQDGLGVLTLIGNPYRRNEGENE